MKKTVSDLSVRGKKVLVRVDFNVPHKGEVITDDNRIKAAIPTIAQLLRQEAKVVLMSHLGKISWKKFAKGEKTAADIEKEMVKNDLYIVLEPLKKYLEQELQRDVVVKFSSKTKGDELKSIVNNLNNGEVVLVQNTRFESGEEKNNPELAKEWAELVDAFVMDAFGSAHRAHASTYGVPEILAKNRKETAVGFLVEKELKALSRCVDCKKDERPYIAILGGSKVSTKIEVIDSLLKKCDKILIGGGMTYTFKKAINNDYTVGDSLFEPEQVEYAKKCYATGKIVLPIDTVCAKGMDFDNLDKPAEDIKLIGADGGIPKGFQGVDIGKSTRELYAREIGKAKTIFWNGPMGVFESDDFDDGTKAVALACADATKRGAFTVIGGGDSAAAAKKFGLEKEFSHVSTGGGASLELIQYSGHLPGIDIIEDK